MSNKKGIYQHLGYCPPESYDDFWLLKSSPKTSRYYEICLKAYGQEMAEYYWNRRHSFDVNRDYEWRSLCKEINAKCDKYLKSKGIKVHNFDKAINANN